MEKDHIFNTTNSIQNDIAIKTNTCESNYSYNQLPLTAIDTICQTMQITPEQIVNINQLKKGMTNRSFLFDCKNKQYIIRFPGKGTQELINRREEADVYSAIKEIDICDDIVYINPNNGYKISEFLPKARTCDALNPEDTQKCMDFLRSFHQKQLTVPHRFDIFKQIEFYESLWNETPSIYCDYRKTKENIFSLKDYIEKNKVSEVLTHMDAVPDNFIFIPNPNGEEDIRLIDWEYAGMQDPHVDIAVFCIYAMYNKEQVNTLINQYFIEGCPQNIRMKIYCYIAVCGLLWSNWCEYKKMLGVEFGKYALCQYQYAKEYFEIVRNEL